MNTDSKTSAPASRSSRLLTLAAALGCYALGCTGLFALILTSFGLYEFQWAPALTGTVGGAVLLGLGLVGLFGVQHTIMARPGFKAWWSRLVPAALERSIFTALSGGLMLLILGLWQPLPGTVWSVEATWLEALLFAVKGAGWAYLLAATFTIGHFDLFGVAGPWRALLNRPAPAKRFSEKLMYRFDRHPIMTGVLVGLWATPHMRVDTLALAAIFTLYIAFGVAVEERELVREHGATYEDYRRRVRTTVPVLPLFARRAERASLASSRS